MVGRALGREQLLPADLALGVELPDAGLLAVRHAGRHRSGGHEDGREVPEGQARRSPGPGRSCRRCPASRRRRTCRGSARSRSPCDHVAADQRQLHAVRPWVTPSHIAGTPPATWATAPAAWAAFADQGREALVGLVRREHVVVGGDDRDVGPGRRQRCLVGVREGGEGVGEVAAGQAGAAGRARRRRAALEIGPRVPSLRAAIRSVTSATTGWTGMSLPGVTARFLEPGAAVALDERDRDRSAPVPAR